MFSFSKNVSTKLVITGREILLFHRVSPSCVAISAVLALSELQALIPLSEKEEGLLFNHLLKHCNFENTHFLGKGISPTLLVAFSPPNNCIVPLKAALSVSPHIQQNVVSFTCLTSCRLDAFSVLTEVPKLML